MNPAKPITAPRLLLTALLLALSPFSWAISPQTEQEIQHLLTYIAAADCEFERNGDTKSPAQAHAHIELKYGNTRKYISSTEDFIKYAASESSWTGRPYKVRCNGVEQTTSVWLNAELKRLRATEPAAALPAKPRTP